MRVHVREKVLTEIAQLYRANAVLSLSLQLPAFVLVLTDSIELRGAQGGSACR